MYYFLDINECLDNNAGCNQICENTNGSYYCSCNSGFEMSSDNHTCIGTYVIYMCLHNVLTVYEHLRLGFFIRIQMIANFLKFLLFLEE